MSSEITKRTEKAWDTGRAGYVCRDGGYVIVPHRSAEVSDLNESKIVPVNRVQYVPGEEPSIAVSGVEYSRNMEKIFGGTDDVLTMIFPDMVRSVRQGSFHGAKGLRSVVLNEGLEVLGTDERKNDKSVECGVFQESGLEKVLLPSTLRTIRREAFMGCADIRGVAFPDGLREIGLRAFRDSGLEEVTLPPSVRVVHQSAFCKCPNLRAARLNEGLEALGTDEYPGNNSWWYGVFEESAI